MLQGKAMATGRCDIRKVKGSVSRGERGEEKGGGERGGVEIKGITGADSTTPIVCASSGHLFITYSVLLIIIEVPGGNGCWSIDAIPLLLLVPLVVPLLMPLLVLL